MKSVAANKNPSITHYIAARQSNIVALSIYSAICMATLAVLIMHSSFPLGFNSFTVAGSILLFTLIFFILSIEFSLLAIYAIEHLEYFAFIGSALYGIGLTLMVIGISMVLNTLDMEQLAYVVLTIFAIGYMLYYIIRILKLGLETVAATRIVLRNCSFLLIGLGYYLIWCL